MVIETHALRKCYAGEFAVRDLNLAIPEGSVRSFLGPNGSGTTTTIRMFRTLCGGGIKFCGLLFMAGSVFIFAGVFWSSLSGRL